MSKQRRLWYASRRPCSTLVTPHVPMCMSTRARRWIRTWCSRSCRLKLGRINHNVHTCGRRRWRVVTAERSQFARHTPFFLYPEVNTSLNSLARCVRWRRGMHEMSFPASGTERTLHCQIRVVPEPLPLSWTCWQLCALTGPPSIWTPRPVCRHTR